MTVHLDIIFDSLDEILYMEIEETIMYFITNY